MTEAGEFLREGYLAFGRRDWRVAREHFSRVADEGGLDADGHLALADCAWWLGDTERALSDYERAHRRYLDDGLAARAAMAALLLGAHAMERGDHTVGSGWMSRARRLLKDTSEGQEHGYPLYWDMFTAMGNDDFEAAVEIARRMQDLGHRFGDANLVAMGAMGEGRVLIKTGDTSRGMALLDDAMLTAVSDELHPVWTGAIYCHLMDVCHELMDLQRAGEWTEATARWCDGMADAVLYRGICRVHRAQVMQRRGAWDDAEREARRASTDLGSVHVGTVAEAQYEMGEIRRLRGDSAGADAHYQQAHELGRDPQPGLALLRAQQGRAATACTSLRTALTERAGDPLGRVRLAAALVDVALDAGELETARVAAAEVRAIAQTYRSDGIEALAHQAQGAVVLADGHAGDALALLRRAVRLWHDLEAPYDAARTRLLLAQAYRELADHDAAIREIDTASEVFDRLDAAVDFRRAARMRDGFSAPDGLSRREVDVLQSVATGMTNQQVAADLHISDKTVARHLANIYVKIGVSSRSAATAYAFEHGLAQPGSP